MPRVMPYVTPRRLDFLLVYWMREGSVSVLSIDKVCGNTVVGLESQVKLGRTFHPVKIAAVRTSLWTGGY